MFPMWFWLLISKTNRICTDRDVLGMTMAGDFLSESTSHESLFNKNKPNRNQEDGENNHLR